MSRTLLHLGLGLLVSLGFSELLDGWQLWVALAMAVSYRVAGSLIDQHFREPSSPERPAG